MRDNCARVTSGPGPSAAIVAVPQPFPLSLLPTHSAVLHREPPPVDSASASCFTTPARTHALRKVTGWNGCDLVVSIAICAIFRAAFSLELVEPCRSMAIASVRLSASAFCAASRAALALPSLEPLFVETG